MFYKRKVNCIIGYGYGSGYDIYPVPILDIGSGYISTLRSQIWIWYYIQKSGYDPVLRLGDHLPFG